jgi:hypothetical protein
MTSRDLGVEGRVTVATPNALSNVTPNAQRAIWVTTTATRSGAQSWAMPKREQGTRSGRSARGEPVTGSIGANHPGGDTSVARS